MSTDSSIKENEEIETQSNPKEEDINKPDETTQNESSETAKIIEEYETKLKDAEDKYIRVFSDFENVKKRLEKEKYQAIEYASEKFAKDLLNPLDSLELALNSSSSENDPTKMLDKVKEGIELTINQFKKVYEKNGIELIDTNNEFDPHFHNAVMQVDSQDHNDGEIVQTLQKGFKYKERVLRPAMVSICKKS